VGSNIAEMYHDSWFVSICRLGIVVLVLFSYPLQLHPCRASLDKVLGRHQASKEVVDANGDVDDDATAADLDHASADIPTRWFVAETAFILVFSFIIALNVSQLDVVRCVCTVFPASVGDLNINMLFPPSRFCLLLGAQGRPPSHLSCRETFLSFFS
jgi:amino acid permease